MDQRLYVCDPQKNKECPKTCCVHNSDASDKFCRMTANKEYSITQPKLIKTWAELKECTSETHTLEIDGGSGWIRPKVADDEHDEFYRSHYLSTHTFYGGQHECSTKILQSCGFDVEIANWDALDYGEHYA